MLSGLIGTLKWWVSLTHEGLFSRWVSCSATVPIHLSLMYFPEDVLLVCLYFKKKIVSPQWQGMIFPPIYFAKSSASSTCMLKSSIHVFLMMLDVMLALGLGIIGPPAHGLTKMHKCGVNSTQLRAIALDSLLFVLASFQQQKDL